MTDIEKRSAGMVGRFFVSGFKLQVSSCGFLEYRFKKYLKFLAS